MCRFLQYSLNWPLLWSFHPQLQCANCCKTVNKNKVLSSSIIKKSVPSSLRLIGARDLLSDRINLLLRVGLTSMRIGCGWGKSPCNNISSNVRKKHSTPDAKKGGQAAKKQLNMLPVIIIERAPQNYDNTSKFFGINSQDNRKKTTSIKACLHQGIILVKKIQ